ncbi:oligosaccharide flippase family protein [Prosthecochloris sp. N3]|uniref:Oligosaccharide flippase family protein n=1 Tax=Prosthecochloris ethylica TaxID=2743976 RepID=A0ABR9XPR8_9CHLB|nr:oligosaccharide flippase family protein [Prosthecochloris ethylica]MBF0635785.1 oligosaccharide flippase family protein [Prosthecochloris ethylica]NUK47083.1 oligosaccharide flippase family protein [Prosthecochloris ethylica]
MKIVLQQAGISFAGFAVGQLLRLILNLVIARLLGAEELGIYALALSVMQIAEVAAVLGLDVLLLRAVNSRPGDGKAPVEVIASALKMSLLVSAAVSAVLVLFAGTLSGVFEAGPLLDMTLTCYALSLPFHVLVAVGGHALQAMRELGPKIVASQILIPGGMIVLTGAVFLAGGREEALLVPMPVAAFVAAVWMGWRLAVRTGIHPLTVLGAPLETGALRSSLPLMLVALAGMVSHWLDILMLGWLQGPSTAGLYQPAVRSAGIIRSFLLAFAAIAAPLFASLHAQRRTEELRHLLQAVTRWIAMTSVPFCVLLMVLPECVLAMFGDEFISAAPVLVLLAAAVLLQAVTGLYDQVLQMGGRGGVSALNAVLALGVHASLNMVLVPRYSLTGAAAAVAVVYLFLAVLRGGQVLVFWRMHLFSRSLFKPLAAGALSGLAAFALRPFAGMLPAGLFLAAGFVVILAVYLPIIRLMKLEREDVEVILELFPQAKKFVRVT